MHSAMPAKRAERVCPDAVFVPPDFTRYRQVSRSVRDIFKRHTDLIEPLSLDEAYLDVTENKTGLATATLVARTIREQIREELNLTASAGVAPACQTCARSIEVEGLDCLAHRFTLFTRQVNYRCQRCVLSATRCV